MEIIDSEKKYLRQKDLAKRYGVSEALIHTLVKDGRLPPPMKWHRMKLWPIEVIERIDKEMNERYLKSIDRKWGGGIG